MTDCVLKCSISVRGIPHGQHGKTSVRSLVSELIGHEAQKIKPVENTDDKWIVLLSSEQHKQEILSKCSREELLISWNSVIIEEALADDIPQLWQDDEIRRQTLEASVISFFPEKVVESHHGCEEVSDLQGGSSVARRSPKHHPGYQSPEHHPGYQSPEHHPGYQSPEHHLGYQSPEHHPGYQSPEHHPGYQSLEHWHQDDFKQQRNVKSFSFIQESYHKPTETPWDFSQQAAKQGAVSQAHPTPRFRDPVYNPSQHQQGHGAHEYKSPSDRCAEQIEEGIHRKEDTPGIHPAFDTIKVLAPHISNEAIQFHFRNPQNGGGDIKDFTRKTDYILITFEDNAVVENVVRKNHMIEEKPVIVSVYTTQPFYDNEVLIKNIKPDTTEEMLKNILEVFTKCKIASIQFDPLNNAAIAQFDRPHPGVAELCKLCNSSESEQFYGKVSKLQVSNALIVKGFTKKPILDVLKYYFQTKESGNTQDVTVDRVEFVSDSSNDCLVFFRDSTGIKNIIRKRNHKIAESEVSVMEYHQCLSMDNEATASGTKTTQIFQLKVDSLKIRFMRKVDQLKQDVENKLKESGVTVNWNEDELDCIVFKYRGRASVAWQRHASEVFNEVYDRLTFTEIPTIDEMWNDVILNLKAVKGLNDNKVKMYLKRPLIVVVGFAEFTTRIVEQIKTLVEEVQITNSQNVLNDTKILQDWQVRLLEDSTFFQNMQTKYDRLLITYDTTKNVVNFEGPSEIISLAEVEMYELLFNACTAEITMISEQQLHLLNEEQVKRYIASKLNVKGVISVCTINTSNISVHSFTKDDLDISVHILKQSLTENIISIDEVSQSLISSSKWSDFVDEMQRKFSGRVLIKQFLNKMHVVIAATDDINDEVTMKVNTFIEENCEYKNTKSFEKGVQNFLQRHKTEDISKICRRNTIKIEYTATGHEFILCGHKDGIEQALLDLVSLSEKVKMHKEQLHMLGFRKFIDSPKGLHSIAYMENTKHCVIQKEEPEEFQDHLTVASTSQRSQVNIIATANLSASTKMYIAHGDLTELKVDVFVNAANINLDHCGGLAKYIVTKGGQTIKNECKQYIAMNGHLLEGECMISGPGNLKCKAVAHVVGPVWKGNLNSNDEYLLIEAVWKGLDACESRSHSSIVIPAISTGIFGYPVKEACLAIVTSVKRYLTQNTKSLIKDVYLCDNNIETVKSFVNAAKSIIGDDNIQIQINETKNATRWTCSPNPEASELKLPVTSPKAGSTHCDIQLIKGEIAKQTADVIVNSVGTDLNLSSGNISKSILHEGGDQIQKDIKTTYPGGISEGKVAVSCPGKLQCKKIYHFCMANWNSTGNPKTKLANMIEWSLKEADVHGYQSIAFPAIGSGILAYPKDVVARILMDSINDYIRRKPQTSVNEVKLVVYPTDTETFQAFKKVHNFSQRDGSVRRPARCFQGQTESLQNQNDELSQLDATQGIQIGNLTVFVKKGDLTLEDTESIVCTTNKNFDLSYGMLSQAAHKMYGTELEMECKSQVGNMQSKGIALTEVKSPTTGRPMKIIFINTEPSEKWEKRIANCFKEAEKCKVSSLGIPTLGTGNQNLAKSTFAQYMFDAVVKHKDAKHLKEVRIVTFDDDAMRTISSVILTKALEYCESKRTKKNTQPVRPNPIVQEAKLIEEVTLYIYADTDEVINQTRQSLQYILSKEIKVEKIESDHIKDLTEEKKEKIIQIKEEFDIVLEINSRLGRIKLSGLNDDVENAVKQVYVVLMEHLNYQKADIFKNTIQWYYFDIDGDSKEKKVPYVPHINLKIEKAWSDGKDVVDITDDAGIVYEINFNNSTEYPKDDPSQTLRVLRKDLIKDAGVDLPPHWDPMYRGEELKSVPLSAQSQEYNDIAKMFSPTKKTIIKIERIQNKTLYQQFAAKKRSIEQTKPSTGTSRRLWHGTSFDALSSINTYGFNRSFCGKNATAYGNGVYFASNPAYSAQARYSSADSQGNRYMYLADVLTGEFTQGKSGMRVPPSKPGAGSHVLYDSVVENTTNPTIFVIFNDTQAYPLYLITFK